MKIVQLIDSLEVGGAERMAVNYANALSRRIEFSGLVATRAEGKLKDQIEKPVNYLFLKRSKTVDLKAALRLKKYCKENKIDFIHAHSSSYFIAVLAKLLFPKIKIVWHDHNGMSEFVQAKKPVIIKLASFFFKGIIVVNHKLQDWAKKELHSDKVIYIPNFSIPETNQKVITQLSGVDGKRILCLANLRPQKNHFMLLEAAEKIVVDFPDWTFHLVGKDFNDDHSEKIKEMIVQKNLHNNIFLYGTITDTAAVIRQSEIAILTSKSEGLPVSLLEFGFERKAVVVTAVGQIPEIITNSVNGYLIKPDAADEFAEAIKSLINNETNRKAFGNALYETILLKYSEKAAIDQYFDWINSLEND